MLQFFFNYKYISLQIKVLAINSATIELRFPLSTFPDLQTLSSVVLLHMQNYLEVPLWKKR